MMGQIDDAGFHTLYYSMNDDLRQKMYEYIIYVYSREADRPVALTCAVFDVEGIARVVWLAYEVCCVCRLGHLYIGCNHQPLSHALTPRSFQQ